MKKNYFLIFYVTSNAVKVLTYKNDYSLDSNSCIHLFRVQSVIKVKRIINIALSLNSNWRLI